MALSLRALSDSEVLSRTQELTRRERHLTLQVLLHLNEIERRKLHLRQGYSSMFDYCTKRLGYSVPAAVRRIQSARCIERFPEVYELLEANEVSLSTISQVSRLLKRDNKDVLLARIRGRSYREVKAIAAEYQPRAVPPDEIQPIAVIVKAPPADPVLFTMNASMPAPSVNTTAGEGACERSNYIRRGCASDIPAVSADISEGLVGAAVIETRRVFTFTATEAFEQKFEKIKSVGWHRLGPNPTFEQVFELAMDCFLDRSDPVARRKRRSRRNGRNRAEGKQTAELHATAQHATDAKPKHRSRYISPSVRDQVFTRDQGCCSYQGPDGRRCGSTRALQLDHITPVARGGASTADNLRLLCAYHNRLEAERLMGVSVKICGKERESAPLLQ